jgi:hypothetical protein
MRRIISVQNKPTIADRLNEFSNWPRSSFHASRAGCNGDEHLDIENELVRLEEIRVERLSLYRLLKISHRLKRHLAARGLPFFKEISNRALAEWSRTDVEKLLDLWRTVAVLNECGLAILLTFA